MAYPITSDSQCENRTYLERKCKYFTFRELCHSDTADKYKINNTCHNRDYIANLRRLVDNLLVPIRFHFMYPMRITSGFRSEELNTRLKGADNSQHKYGMAVDMYIPNIDNLLVANFIIENMDWDQIILENYTHGNSGWIHLSYVGKGNRKSILTKTIGVSGYQEGIQLKMPPVFN